MTTNNAVNVSLSGNTGTGSFVGSTSPTLVTPVLGAASATSVTFTSTTGIIGSTTNDAAAAGSVGEYISSSVATPGTSLSNGAAADVTSVSLTAGDWDVHGSVFTAVGGTTTTSRVSGWISTASATPPTAPAGGAYVYYDMPSASDTGEPTYFYVGQARLSLSTTTTVYLSTACNFATSTMTAFGFLGARRVR